MKCLAITVAAVAILALVPAAAAQYFTDGYLLSGASIQKMDDKGSFTTLFDNPSWAHGVRMDIDNKHVLFSVGDLLRLDPATTKVTTVMAFGFGTDCNVIIDHNGDYLLTGRDPVAGWGLFRISGTTVTTVITTLKMGLNAQPTAGLVRDIDNGHYVMQLYGGPYPSSHPMVSVAPDGTFTTVVATVSTIYTPRFEFTQDIATGDFYVGARDPSQGALLQVAKNGMSTLVASSVNDVFAFSVLAADRASAASPRLVHPYRGSLYYTDLNNFSVTSVVVNGFSVSPRCIDFYRGRNIQSVRTAPGKYTLNFSFPGYPGKSYVAAMGFSGVRPGILLGDGRRIAINPDALTALTVANQLPQLFHPGIGTLDSSGEARGMLDVSFLPYLGLPVHVMAIVLDSSAPVGFAVIASPFVMIV